MVTRLAWLLLLLAVPAAPVSGQATRPAGLDSASVLLLKPDRFIRIQVPGMGRLTGNVALRSASELTLMTETDSRAISLGSIDTLWVRGRRTKTGAIVGGILGIGGGIFLGALGEALCEYDCEGNYIVGGALFGAAAGGAAGAIVGTAIPRWKRVFPD
jgi:hypothetical protein